MSIRIPKYNKKLKFVFFNLELKHDNCICCDQSKESKNSGEIEIKSFQRSYWVFKAWLIQQVSNLIVQIVVQRIKMCHLLQKCGILFNCFNEDLGLNKIILTNETLPHTTRIGYLDRMEISYSLGSYSIAIG